jgi:hypothetical protein
MQHKTKKEVILIPTTHFPNLYQVQGQVINKRSMELLLSPTSLHQVNL